MVFRFLNNKRYVDTINGDYYVVAEHRDMAIDTMAITFPYSRDMIAARYDILEMRTNRPILLANPEWVVPT